jgi:hypothetical protein
MRETHLPKGRRVRCVPTLLVAFAVTVIAVLALLYNTIKDVLRNANSQLQGIR